MSDSVAVHSRPLHLSPLDVRRCPACYGALPDEGAACCSGVCTVRERLAELMHLAEQQVRGGELDPNARAYVMGRANGLQTALRALELLQVGHA